MPAELDTGHATVKLDGIRPRAADRRSLFGSSMFTTISKRDHNLMRRINRWAAPQWVRLWMIWATRLGDGWLWSMMGLIILLFGGADRYAALSAAGLASASGTLLFMTIKRLCGRERPCASEPHCWASLLPPDQFSFPSGHSINAFAITTPLILFYPALSIGLLFCAGSVALSRILLGLHFLSDVIAGCVIGTLIGYGAYLLVLYS